MTSRQQSPAPNPGSGPGTGRAGVIARRAGPAAIVAGFVLMCAWSWRKWPDIVVDFGKELYIAWQLAEGRTLYTDIAYFNGPLSPYLNALWFRLFGASFMTLALCNIAILALILWMLWIILVRIAGRGAATAGCLFFVAIFAFGQFTLIGNYNYVCPITHEINHGMALSLSSMLLLSLWAGKRRAWLAAACGGALGLVFLTRAELFLAAALAVAAGFALIVRAELPGARRWLASAGTIAGFAAAVPALAFFLLATRMSAGQALVGTLGTWPSVVRGDVARLPFYRRGMGLDDPAVNLGKLALWSALYAAFFGLAALIARGTLRGDRSAGRGSGVRAAGAGSNARALLTERGIAAAVLLAVGGTLLLARPAIAWNDIARPFPIVILALGVWCLRGDLRCPGEDRGRGILRFSMIVFALGMLFKMILYTRLHHYGFAHAMPAAMLAIAAAIAWVPRWIAGRGGSPLVFRAAAVAVLAVILVEFLQTNAFIFAGRIFPVAQGADRIIADERGRFVSDVLDELARRAAPGETLAVFPEGAMLNFLARRANPTPYPILMPTEMTMFGEDRILGALEAHPPDYIALVHRNTSEFGVTFFGRDYAQRIRTWIMSRYEPVFQAGAEPFQDQRFGIILLHRR